MTPLRMIPYARVSTRERGRDDDQDPLVQLDALRPWMDGRGWVALPPEFDRITGDEAKRKGDPPGLARALARIERKEADGLAIFAADRLIRSPGGLLSFVSRVQAAGGKVASLQDGADLDTTTDQGELLLFLRGWWARMELRLLRARTRAGLERARAEGKRLGRPPANVPAAHVARALELRATHAHNWPPPSWEAISRVLAKAGMVQPERIVAGRKRPARAWPTGTLRDACARVEKGGVGIATENREK